MAVQTYINALQPVNVGGALAAGQEQGRKDAQQLAVRNALANYQANPQAAQNALVAAGDIQGASSLSKFAETQRAATVRDQIAPMVKSGDYTGAAKTAAAGGDFETAGALGKLNDAQLEKVQKLAEAKASASYTLRQLPADQRPAALQQMIPQLTQLGIPADQIGQTPLTDDYLDRSISEGMSLKEKVAQTTSQRDFEAKRTDAANVQADRLADNDRQTKAEAARERADAAREGRLLAAVGGANGALWVQKSTPDGMTYLENQRTGDRKTDPSSKGQQPDRKTEMDLRKEFDAQPEVKNFRVISTAARQVKSLADGAASPQNDIALVYAYMRANDPNSVVREGEFATAQNAASLPDSVRNQLNKVISGQRLNPQQRQNMVKTVKQIAQASGDRFATVSDNYRTYAQQAGANPDHIVKYERKTTTTGGPAPAGPANRKPLDEIFK